VIATRGLVIGALVAIAAGCGAGQGGARGSYTRPLGEDPLALMPSGAELVLDVDIEQLRRWPATDRLLKALPEDAQARLRRLGFDPLAELEALYVTVAQVGTPEASATFLLKGELDLAKVRGAAGPAGQITSVLYRDVALHEGPDGAVARLTPHLVIIGSRVDVRRAIDLVQQQGDSIRSADKSLMAAFARAPTAKVGRPALMLGVIPSEPLKERLRKENLPGAELLWVSMSLAVGDGFDIGGVAGLKGPVEASTLVASAKTTVQQFAAKTAVRLLGLRPFIDPLTLKAREATVYLGYRVTAPLVEQMLGKLESLHAMAKPRKSGAMGLDE
jgi:hypothetical protein